MAAQVEATAVPLREYDEVTVQGLPEVIEVPAFGGFDDFELDLSCLSPPPSPPASVSELPQANSRPSSPSPRSSISTSATHTTASRKHLLGAGTSTARGAWPLVKYVGRGTPIDRNRRIEWSGAGGGAEEVGEDGVLFSEVRSTSLDSAIRPSRSQRSLSPEWNFLATPPLGRRSSTLPPRSRAFAPPPVIETPEIKIEGLGDAEEWASFMQTVLGSAESASTSASASGSTSNLATIAPGPASTPEPKETFRSTPTPAAPFTPTMSPEEMQQLSNGLEMDLNIDAALDLGLGVGDDGTQMNYFNLGLLPESGRASPSSVYSSPPPSPRASSPPTVSVSDNRSTTSTKAEAGVGLGVNLKSVSQPWWRRILSRFRRVHSLLGSH